MICYPMQYTYNAVYITILLCNIIIIIIYYFFLSGILHLITVCGVLLSLCRKYISNNTIIPVHSLCFPKPKTWTKTIYGWSYLVKMPLGEQDGTHGLRTPVVRRSVFVVISIPPAGLSPLPSSVSEGTGATDLVRSKSAGSSSTHFSAKYTGEKFNIR